MLSASTNYQAINLKDDEYLVCDSQGFLGLVSSKKLLTEERMINIISESSDISLVARKITDFDAVDFINEWFIEVRHIDDIEDRKIKFLSSAPELFRRVRFVVNTADIDSKQLERCSLVGRILLTGEGVDPFDKEWDLLREKWVQYLLWCADKINVAYTEESFSFLSPALVPRLNKPVGSKPKTFIIYQGLISE